MSIVTLLDMACSGSPERIAVGNRTSGLTYERLAAIADGGARLLLASGGQSLAFVGVNGPHWPVIMFAAAKAGIPVVPLNYRLSIDQLAGLVRRLEDPVVVVDDRYAEALSGALGTTMTTTSSWVAQAVAASSTDPVVHDPDGGDQPAVVLFTSGTTADPKGVVLRHSNLLSYVIQTVEFGSAGSEDAALISVPPYHVAGVGTVLTNVYAGRRLVYLEDFSPAGWLSLVRDEGVTQAMVVPTMLARIVDELDELGERIAPTPTLRSIAYGGAAMPRPVLERALRLFPTVGFANSYGLTETSSTVAILGPEDHRVAMASGDPAIRDRLGSVGRLVPGVEASIRDEQGREVPPGGAGELWLRGDQISSEYLGEVRHDVDGGWFWTRDRARLDRDGYLYVLGRTDDTIIRGGENIAPAEIESALLEHPAVRDAGVVGVPDEEWGQCTVAVVTLLPGHNLTEDGLRAWVRGRVRGSRTPDRVVFREELPYNPLGKLLRRDLLADLETELVNGRTA